MTIRHLYPAVEPSLNLDFANSKKLDPRITFTRASTGTYVGADGLIKTAATNEARFDHDGDGNSLGLLIEESRTNLITQSNSLSSFSYTSHTLSTNVTTSPDGTTNASSVTSGGGGTAYKFTTTSNPSIFSIYCKANSVGWVYISVTGSGSSWFNLQTGEKGTGVGSIQALPGGWNRISITTTSTGSIQTQFFPTIANGSFDRSAGNSIFVWGAQLEAGSFPTSYIPTSGSTVTRSADVASMTGTNFSSWYTPLENTMSIDFSTTDVSANSKPGFVIYDSTQGSGIRATVEGARAFYYVGTTNYIQVTTRTPQSVRRTFAGDSNYNALGQINKVAQAYAGSTDKGCAINGADPSFTTSTSVNPGNVDSMWIGRDENVGTWLNGYISRITHYPTRLPDATLQALTL